MPITLLIHDARWKGLGATVRRAAEAALHHRKVTGAALTLVLADDAQVQVLNRDFRGKDKPTNVLSFPDGAMAGRSKQLGDIILAYETMAREAQAQEKKLKDHVTHLTIHGVLHLLGFDHEIEDEAQIMERHEIAILKRMGIANPYESA